MQHEFVVRTKDKRSHTIGMLIGAESCAPRGENRLRVAVGYVRLQLDNPEDIRDILFGTVKEARQMVRSNWGAKWAEAPIQVNIHWQSFFGYSVGAAQSARMLLAKKAIANTVLTGMGRQRMFQSGVYLDNVAIPFGEEADKKCLYGSFAVSSDVVYFNTEPSGIPMAVHMCGNYEYPEAMMYMGAPGFNGISIEGNRKAVVVKFIDAVINREKKILEHTQRIMPRIDTTD